jgi:predicted permease
MWARFRSWLTGVTRRTRVERELDDELAFHLRAAGERWQERGLSPAEAQRRARLEFGAADAFRERCREARGLRLVDELRADVRFALRLMRRTPVFASAAILTIALAIGANTAIFSLVDTILLKTLPVDRPQELVFLDVRGSEGGGGAPPYPGFERLRADTTSFVGMSAFAADELRVEIEGRVEQVFGQAASANFFDVLGLKPAAGRFLNPADEQGESNSAVMSYGFWQRRFGGAPDAIGRTITYNRRIFTIVGVTPAGFLGLQPGREIELTIPIVIERALLANHDTWWFEAVARLRPGVTAEQARVRADTIFQTYMKDHQKPSPMRRTYFDHIELASAARGLDRLRGRFFTPLAALMGLAGAVLLIACANLVNLLHARGTARARELAIRLATGAGRSRLVRQMLTETLVLFLAGGLLGLALGYLAVQGLTGFVAIGRQPIHLDVRFDWRLAGFAGSISLLAAFATGVWPAIRALRGDPSAAMKQGTAGLTGSRRPEVAGRALVVGQVALSLMLTVAAAFFARSLVNLRAVDLGFRETRVLTMSLDPMLPDQSAAAAAPAAETRQQFWARTLDRVRAMPGVRAASLSVLTPLSGRDTGRRIEVAGFQPQSERDRTIHVNHVSEDYFRVFGIPLLAGRAVTASDVAGRPGVVVVNEEAARFYFPGRSPIGERITFGDRGSYEVVGVVGNARHRSLREPIVRFAYVSVWQPLGPNRRITLSLTSAQPPTAIAREVADAVRGINSSTLVSDVLAVEEQIDATLVSERLLSTLGGAFAALAVGLAAIGLYGVLSYSVARRRAEFGVRLALGAPPARVAWDASRQALVQVAIGMAIGVPGAVVLARAAQRLFFGVEPADPGIYVICLVVLGGIAALAASLPARRASRVDPVIALREG